ncbi:C-type lectin domain family 3 member A [Mizuhopecten yessoensis]|uniref:C-type lectin domain family 3 member A n=1 Tax=Mizuhopecten yessoensis TaxID=6573 RepID=A0A210PV12_MIZYE|nr:C-type lectin domain family 3 member A [Mizuhopecten yessoensis]
MSGRVYKAWYILLHRTSREGRLEPGHRAYSPPEFWIAGNDILEEGHWQWASGKPVTFANWDDDQPDNGGDHDNNEHCMEVKQKDQWKWNDQECQEYRFFICEMPITDNIGGSQPGIIG